MLSALSLVYDLAAISRFCRHERFLILYNIHNFTIIFLLSGMIKFEQFPTSYVNQLLR